MARGMLINNNEYVEVDMKILVINDNKSILDELKECGVNINPVCEIKKIKIHLQWKKIFQQSSLFKRNHLSRVFPSNIISKNQDVKFPCCCRWVLVSWLVSWLQSWAWAVVLSWSRLFFSCYWRSAVPCPCGGYRLSM